jgi:hypothetical protein
VPLKTYLPDGDIDLSLLGAHDALRADSWTDTVCAALKANADALALTDVVVINAEVRRQLPHTRAAPAPASAAQRPQRPRRTHAHAAKFAPSLRRCALVVVRTVQVKVVKCMLRGVVVDISANTLGGVATLGFLEEARGRR